MHLGITASSVDVVAYSDDAQNKKSYVEEIVKVFVEEIRTKQARQEAQLRKSENDISNIGDHVDLFESHFSCAE